MLTQESREPAVQSSVQETAMAKSGNRSRSGSNFNNGLNISVYLLLRSQWAIPQQLLKPRLSQGVMPDELISADPPCCGPPSGLRSCRIRERTRFYYRRHIMSEVIFKAP